MFHDMCMYMHTQYIEDHGGTDTKIVHIHRAGFA